MLYRTSEVGLAASLKVKGYNLSSVELQGSKGIFVFEAVEQEFLDQFDLGQILVEPTTFHGAVKQLTTIVRRKINN
jgi:hypothetical protein